MSVTNTGDVIGSYRVVSLLGRGGMGEVFEVEHEKLGVRYALKTFTLEEGQTDFFRERFVAEGKILARLRHPNIARVFDLDVDEKTGLLYFVMDLVRYKDGRSYTLSDLEQGGAEEAYIADWFVKLASALDYVHGQSVVHRDIKLENILLSGNGDVVLSDFGISRFVSEHIRRELHVERTMVTTDDGRRAPGAVVLGTRGYMAPEVACGKPATVAADTYSLGVAFFRLLTGIWYEPETDVLKLLEPFEGPWMEILPPMLERNPAKRPVLLSEIAEKLSAAFPETPRTLKTLRFYDPSTALTKKRLTDAIPGFRWIAGALAAAGLMVVWMCGFFGHGTATSDDSAPVESVGPTATVAALDEKVLLQIADGVSLTFVRCPAQTFEMSNALGGNGGDKTHTVTLTHDFWIANALVPTNLLAKTGLDGIKAWLTASNRRFAGKLPEGTVLRLPTEAEWEASMRAGLFKPDYGFEATADTVQGRYAKKYAWKAELDSLVYGERETDPHRTAVVGAAWVCRQKQFKRHLLRPDNDGVRIRLAIGQPLN